MIKNRTKWTQWEDDLARRTPVDYERNLETFEALYKHAQDMGALKKREAMEGLESVLRIARILNV